ncbi:MAG: DUF1810 domain-containing protein [Chloroflexota bacterium]
MAADPFDLERFVRAQDATWADVVRELRDGRKRSHWIWWVFPQLRGLGRSDHSWTYGITGLPEARAYLAHPLLGPRLLEVCDLLLAAPGDDPEAILGETDAKKVRSCMTLFRQVAPNEPRFQRVLDRYWAGVPDPITLEMLG